MEGRHNDYIKFKGYTTEDEVNKVTDKFTAVTKSGYKLLTTVNQIQKGYPTRIVTTSNPYSTDNLKLWVELNRPEFKVEGGYVSADIPMVFICKKCGHCMKLTWRRFKKGWPCNTCGMGGK